ncbi:SMI1/KNR4 family protein [Cronbergia sp. UHCC 0137]|uniref:SMI1/KNR4 family protein n=1 Tax=Cronbergia sp. UHCC 0137 TaxID=3110239 RepID=UPI002B2027E3|nr:SMI1/KNR4 family protein [Cronbergia sp. UHCC 0137]MEA5618581.1 SMI1/KNR4 family protein [Cronbergia sp. UHCC 0137]
MINYDWEHLLKKFSYKLIEGRREYDRWELTPEIVASKWLGNPSASEEQIVLAETRLGKRFPPSYREFLKVSNGWCNSDWTDLQLWSTEEIEWFSTRNEDWILAWQLDINEVPSVPDDQYFVYGEAQDCIYLRREYLPTALEISSDSGDGDIFLLIPDVVFENGEWEAWHFGNKLPGANRYRSFYELMLKVTEQGSFIY